MNINFIKGTNHETGQSIELLNAYKWCHSEFVPFDTKNINKLIYDITIPHIRNETLLYDIRMITGIKEINGTVHIAYAETDMENKMERQNLFENESAETTNEYFQLQRSTILATIGWYPNRPIIISITERLHKKILSTIREQKYFTKMIGYGQNQGMDPIETNYIKGAPCEIFNTKKFAMPSLRHLLIVYLHRNIKISKLVNMENTINSYTDHLQTLFSLHIPSNTLIDLWGIHTSCPYHHEQTEENIKLNPERFFIRQGSELDNRLLSLHVPAREHWLFDKPTVKIIRIQAFMDNPLNTYTEDILKVMNNGIGEIELYQ